MESESVYMSACKGVLVCASELERENECERESEKVRVFKSVHAFNLFQFQFKHNKKSFIAYFYVIMISLYISHAELRELLEQLLKRGDQPQPQGDGTNPPQDSASSEGGKGDGKPCKCVSELIYKYIHHIM